MKVLSYKKKKANTYIVSFDTGEDYELYDDIILKYELLIDSRLDEKKLAKIKEENSSLEAYYKALKYIAVRMRTEYEIAVYLKKNEFEPKERKYALKRLKDEGYINEKRYVEAFVTDQLNLTMNGPKKIITMLTKLKVNEQMVSERLDMIPQEVWLERIKKITLKKSKVNKNSEKMFKNKMMTDLITLGYRTEDIHEILDDYKLDDREALKSIGDKLYSKLSLKYSDSSLEFAFRSKMFAKGFSSDQVNSYLREKDRD